ncbi:formate/nitrite transporter family protein [Neisseria sp. Ec49-e6-T10]|uniref:formate/nitrite transporter family protein n=1 Tax=Neisseria sp. Ec49-e6-T10 TaxID=3140744 RepID=UPI003EBF8B57
MCSNKQGGILSPLEIAQTAENTGYYKVSKYSLFTLCSAIVAGVFISIAFAFYTTVTTGTANVPYGLAKLIGGICFSLGLTLVGIYGVNLFSSIILNIISTAQGKFAWLKLLSPYYLVYFSNFIATLIFIVIIWFAHPNIFAKGLWSLNILETASYKLQEVFFLGMAVPDFWLLVNNSTEHYQYLTSNQFVIKNLIPVTLSNIVGGMVVGLTFWWILLKKKTRSVSINETLCS